MIYDDADLVQAARRGDRDAFGILADRHRARAARLAAAMLGDATEAEDIAQEALYQAYFGIDRLHDPARFGAWLCGIAVNLARMALRRRRMSVSLEDLDGGHVAHGFRLEDATPEAAFEARELRQVVQRAIHQLPEDMRAAVWLHYVEGLSYQEISALFGVAPGALRVKAHRARRQLRQALIGEWRGEGLQSEVNMIEVTVHDVLMWTPQDWHPKPVEGQRQFPELPSSRQCVALLKEKEGERALPVWIGPHEAELIVLHLAEIQTLRPLTYDFMARLLTATNVTVDRVAVSELKGDTFIATVTVRSGRQVQDVDARPSDAINLALRLQTPIFVDADVMERGKSVRLADAPTELSREFAEGAARRGEAVEEGSWRSAREIALAQKGAGESKPC